MASFTETATLKVNDQSSAEIKRINAALRQLMRTARSLKSASANIDIKTKGMAQASTMMKALAHDAKALKSTAATINVKLVGAAAARQQLAQLRAQGQRGINVGGAGGGGGGGGRGRRGGQGPLGAGFRGSMSGAGVASVAGMYGSFGAVAVAGYAAAAALRSVATNAAKRDRTNLQSAVAASQAQRDVFSQRDKAAGGRVPGPLPVTQDEFSRFRTSLLGDVPGKTEEDRADNADKMARKVVNDILPRLYAQDPTRSREETLEGARNFVKSLNLASSELYDSAGNFSKDAERVMKGIQLAQAANPELRSETVRTVMANLKASAKSLSPEALAQVLIASGDQGVRAANELHQAIQGFSGTKDVKHLNEAMAERGFMTDFKRKGPKENKAIVPGSGKILDQKLLFEDPQLWMLKHYKPQMDKALKKQADERQAEARKAGKSPEEVAAAGVINNADVVAQVNKDWAGMRETAKNAITEVMTGFQQAQTTLDQAKTSLAQPVAEAMSKSWVTAAESVKVAWTDAAAGLGEKIAAGINLNAILTGIADKIRDQPEIATAIGGAVGLAVTGGLGLAATRAFMAPAGALSGAAAELSAAAAVLSGGAGIPDVPGSGKSKANVWDKVAAVAATVATVGASVTAGLAVPAATSYLESPLSETGKAFEAANQSALSLAYAQLDLHNKTQRLADLEAQRIAPKAETPFDKFQPTYPEQVETEKQSLRTEIERLTNAIAQWQSGTPWEQAVKALQQQPVEQKQPNWVAGAIAEIRKAQLPPDWKPSEQTKPEMKWPDPTVISSASDVMRAAMEAGGTQIQGAANTLSNTTGTFSAVFATGAQAIGSSGQMAASTLQGAAPGIGQSIGAAAAAAIQAAVANLNVNVNANVVGGGSDKGSIKEVGK